MSASPCPDEDTLSLLADDLLPPAEAAALGAHSESCPSCRRLVGMLMKLRSRRSGSEPGEPPVEDAPALPLGSTLGRYVLRRFVGAGAMGVVFEAEDPSLQRRVAVKVMRSASSPSAQALLQREAQVMAQLSHHNVATVFDVGVVEGRTWVAMEFIEGTTFRSWLQASPRDEATITSRLLDAGRGLAAAHAAGVVHRDFKPDNVLIEQARARVVVTDFGLSVGSGGTASPTRSLVGTPAYMPPEQRLGQADAASDQFSFCITAVEAFTGRRPFDTGVMDEGVLALLPRRVRPVLTRGLALEPTKRWPSLEALLTALAPPRRERQVLATAAVLSAVAVGAVSVGGWRRAHVCDGAAEKVHAVWNAEARTKLSAAFLATGVPFAPGAAEALSAQLDGWASRWAAHATEVCEATELRHTQSGELMDLRRACLDERLEEVAALTTALSHADVAVVKGASAIGQRLTPLSQCDDERALRAPVPLPASPQLAARVTALRESLATASALRVTSQLKSARAALIPLEAEALDAGHRPLEAEVLLQAGLLATELEDFEGSSQKLEQALIAAQAGGHTQAAAQAWIGLALLEGVHLGHPAQGQRAAALASAASERLGRPLVIEAALATNVGTLLH